VPRETLVPKDSTRPAAALHGRELIRESILVETGERFLRSAVVIERFEEAEPPLRRKKNQLRTPA